MLSVEFLWDTRKNRTMMHLLDINKFQNLLSNFNHGKEIPKEMEIFPSSEIVHHLDSRTVACESGVRGKVGSTFRNTAGGKEMNT